MAELTSRGSRLAIDSGVLACSVRIVHCAALPNLELEFHHRHGHYDLYSPTTRSFDQEERRVSAKEDGRD